MTPHHRASMLYLMAASKGLLLNGGLLRAFPNSTLPYWNHTGSSLAHSIPSRSGDAPLNSRCGARGHTLDPGAGAATEMVNGEKAPTPPLLRLETLLALGLDQRTTENALVNSKVTANLAAVVAEVRNSLLLSPVQHSLDFGERCSALHLPQGFGFCSPTLRVASAYYPDQIGATYNLWDALPCLFWAF
ncbi:hypothetical protein ZWY2020_011184 [Hordeum vulgare]|nr:hypothetical protein ZWY2020_011184 [Hordeum vulgare]